MKYPSLKAHGITCDLGSSSSLTLISCSQHTGKPTKVTTIQYPKPLPRVATNAPMCPQFSIVIY